MYLKKPAEGETFATGMVRPKTTALLFDWLWVHPALIEKGSVKNLSPYAVPAEIVPGYAMASDVGQVATSVYGGAVMGNVGGAVMGNVAAQVVFSGTINVVNYSAPKSETIRSSEPPPNRPPLPPAESGRQSDHPLAQRTAPNRPPLSLAERALLQYMLRENNLSDNEREIIAAMVAASEDIKDSSEFAWSEQSENTQEVQYRDDHGFQPTKYRTTPTGFRTTVHRNRALRTIVRIYERQGIELTPIYHDPTEYDELEPDFHQTQAGIEVSLDFVPVAVEDKLSWKQVLEFRRDTEAREKLRRMRNWFTLELAGKSEAEIRATLEEQLDDYSWALRKHGIATTVGGFTSFLGVAAAPATLSLLTASPLAVMAGGIALAAGAVAWLAHKQVERTELRRSEIAYLHEVRKLVG